MYQPNPHILTNPDGRFKTFTPSQFRQGDQVTIETASGELTGTVIKPIFTVTREWLYRIREQRSGTLLVLPEQCLRRGLI